MNKLWNYIATVADGEKVEIDGLNIWDYNWKQTGEIAIISDPINKNQFCFNVYEIRNGSIKIEFAAGEFSNCVFGIFQSQAVI